MIEQLIGKMSPKNRQILMLGGPILAGSFLGWNLVVKPHMAAIRYAQTEVQNLSSKESSFSNIGVLEKKLTDFKKRFSTSSDSTWLVDQLNSIANESSFTILSVKPEDDLAMLGGYLTRILVRIEADANFHQLGKFVSRVENLEQFVKIVVLEIDTGDVSDTGSSRKPTTYKILLNVGMFHPSPGAL